VKYNDTAMGNRMCIMSCWHCGTSYYCSREQGFACVFVGLNHYLRHSLVVYIQVAIVLSNPRPLATRCNDGYSCWIQCGFRFNPLPTEVLIMYTASIFDPNVELNALMQRSFLSLKWGAMRNLKLYLKT